MSPDFESIFFLVAAAGYTLAFAYGLSHLRRGYDGPRGWLLAIMAVSFLAQTMALHSRGTRFGGCPLGNPFEIVQFLVWSLVLFYFLVGPVFRMSLLGFFSGGLAALLSILTLAIPSWDATRREGTVFGGNPWVEAHASLAMLSYGAFGLLALLGAMFLLQHAALRRKRTGGIFALLPSVVQLDLMARRVIGVGVAGLTFALLVAAVGQVRHPLPVNPGKILAVVVVWMISGAVLVARRRGHLSGPRAAFAGIVLFVLALASLVPVVGKSAHARPTHAAATVAPLPSP